MRNSHTVQTEELRNIIEEEKLRYKEAVDKNETKPIIISILNHIKFLENQLQVLKSRGK